MQERSAGAVALVDVSGRLVAGDDNGRLKDKVNSLLLQGRRQIVLNLGGGAIHRQHGARRAGRDARDGDQARRADRARAAHQRVQDLLAICRLLTVFDSFDTEAEALSSFPPLT